MISPPVPPRPSRLARGAAVAALTGGLLLALAGPAGAVNGDYGSPAPMSKLATVAVFVGCPLLVVLVTAAFTLPRGRKASALSYRPGRRWGQPRVWFGAQPPATTSTPRVTAPGTGGAGAQF